MPLEFTKPVPPLYPATTAVIVIGRDMSVESATRVKDKIRLLKRCQETDLVLIAVAWPSTIDVVAVTAQDAMERLQQDVPRDPTFYFRRFGEKPEP